MSLLRRRPFPLSRLSTKGQLYDIEGTFRSQPIGKSVPYDAQTLNPQFLAEGKSSFENAASLFLMGLATERGALPSLEQAAFEPQLVKAVMDLRNEGHRIELNHNIRRLSRVTTQATQVLAYENIFCNEAALVNGGNPVQMSVPLVNSERVRRYIASSMGSGMLNLSLIRRAHIQVVSNLKLRVLEPSSAIETEAEMEEDEDEVVYGDGTSGFLSSTYQAYAFTFEQKVSLKSSLRLRHCFRFEQELINDFRESGMLEQTQEIQNDTEQDQIDNSHVERKFKRQALSKLNELKLTEESYPIGELDDRDWRIADFQFWLRGNSPIGREPYHD